MNKSNLASGTDDIPLLTTLGLETIVT